MLWFRREANRAFIEPRVSLRWAGYIAIPAQYLWLPPTFEKSRLVVVVFFIPIFQEEGFKIREVAWLSESDPPNHTVPKKLVNLKDN
jgi:hypothetical protein